jgi:hypothetical protein
MLVSPARAPLAYWKLLLGIVVWFDQLQIRVEGVYGTFSWLQHD